VTPSTHFRRGDQVRACRGPFAPFVGVVTDVDEHEGTLKVAVSVFGRPTPVELEIEQVEKV